jgi:predicted Zn finger-like uncharacterized protein
MNVSCPQCSTVYRVDPAKVPEGGVRARCSACGGVIPVGVGAQAAVHETPAQAMGAAFAERRPQPGPFMPGAQNDAACPAAGYTSCAASHNAARAVARSNSAATAGRAASAGAAHATRAGSSDAHADGTAAGFITGATASCDLGPPRDAPLGVSADHTCCPFGTGTRTIGASISTSGCSSCSHGHSASCQPVPCPRSRSSRKTSGARTRFRHGCVLSCEARRRSRKGNAQGAVPRRDQEEL